MKVDRCVCVNTTFRELKKKGQNLSFEELKNDTQCGMRCGNCEPYVRLMIKTGQTEFEPMCEDTLRRRLDVSG